ncbi:MAG: RodZ domain-containing protein [Candidatus Acidiferrales bacterium]
MATFGESLRRERELRGITLPELSNATKISLRYLRSLENNQFERLPGGIFNRGFVRAVARYLRIDEAHWVGEYVRAAHEEPEMVARYAPPTTKSSSSHVGVWTLAVLVAGFGISAYVVHEIRSQRAAEAAQSADVLAGQDDARTAAPQPDAKENAPALEESEPETPPVAAASPPSRATAPATVPAQTGGRLAAPVTGELRLQVDVMEDAWLTIRVDGEPAFSGTMRPGESRTFSGTAKIELSTGNASAVVLTLNGETLAPLGNPGEVKRVTLTAKDLRPATP